MVSFESAWTLVFDFQSSWMRAWNIGCFIVMLKFDRWHPDLFPLWRAFKKKKKIQTNLLRYEEMFTFIRNISNKSKRNLVICPSKPNCESENNNWHRNYISGLYKTCFNIKIIKNLFRHISSKTITLGTN